MCSVGVSSENSLWNNGFRLRDLGTNFFLFLFCLTKSRVLNLPVIHGRGGYR